MSDTFAATYPSSVYY